MKKEKALKEYIRYAAYVADLEARGAYAEEEQYEMEAMRSDLIEVYGFTEQEVKQAERKISVAEYVHTPCGNLVMI